AGIFQLCDEFAREEKTIGGQAGGKTEFAAVANKFDNIWMHERLAADQSDAHGAKFPNFPNPFLQIVEAGMRPAVVVLGAIGTIEIATIRDVKTALEGFSVEETLTRFQNVIAGKFAANVVEELHAVWAGQTLSVGQSPIDAKMTAPIHSLDRTRLVDFSQLLSSRVFRRNVSHGAPSHAI